MVRKIKYQKILINVWLKNTNYFVRQLNIYSNNYILFDVVSLAVKLEQLNH